jgi:hypothetical protein
MDAQKSLQAMKLIDQALLPKAQVKALLLAIHRLSRGRLRKTMPMWLVKA